MLCQRWPFFVPVHEAAELVIRVVFGIPLRCAAEGKAKKLWRSKSKGRDVRGNGSTKWTMEVETQGAREGLRLERESYWKLRRRQSFWSCCVALLSWRIGGWVFKALKLVFRQRNKQAEEPQGKGSDPVMLELGAIDAVHQYRTEVWGCSPSRMLATAPHWCSWQGSWTEG